MRLSQAVSVIEQAFEDWREKRSNLMADCKTFFPKIIQKDGEPVEWEKRDLVDGGVLDNKPFGYAIDVLTQRRADFQVERKLLYIEPSPEAFPNTKTKEEMPPNVLENAVASLSSIPSYETIREDLEKLLERNRLIERVNLIIRNAEQDVFEQLISSARGDTGIDKDKQQQGGGKFWETQGLEDVSRLKGRAVLPYYRLRIAALTDDIARLVTQINGVDEKSEYFEAIRKLVKIWRLENFSDYQKEPKPKGTVLGFLRNFDLVYRLRRLRFVQMKASRLYFNEMDFREEMCERYDKFTKIRTEKESQTKSEAVAVEENPFVEESIKIPLKDWKTFVETIDWTLCEMHSYDNNSTTAVEMKGEFIERKPSEILYLLRLQTNSEYRSQVRRAITFFQNQMGSVFKDLQKKSKELSGAQQNLLETINKIKLEKEDLEKLLDLTEKNFINTTTGNPEVKRLWEKFQLQINSAADELEISFKTIFDESRARIEEIFKSEAIPDEIKDKQGKGIWLIVFKAVRGYLKHYYNNFDEYDQISFPIFYQTQVGESVKIDVMRISPKDAIGLIDEKESGKMKLAGESLFHFGAFLDRVWRWNDIMWGRLDGSERLITSLLPDAEYKEIRAYLTKKAQVKILEEEFLSANNEALQGVLAESLTKVSAGLKMQEVVEQILQNIGDETVNTKLGKVLGTCLDKDTVYDFVQKHYEVEKQLEPKPLLRVISRSTKVTGDIFEGIADEKAAVGSQMRWIARLGRIFGGLVEVAAPQTVWYEFLKHGLLLLYLFEIVLLVGSTIFVATEVQQFAIVSLILTLLVHFIAILLNEYMSGRKFLNLLKFLLIALVALPAVTGVLVMFAFFYKPSWWVKINTVQVNSLKDEYGWLRLLPLLIVIMVFAIAFIWKAVRDRKFARDRKIQTRID
jgi:patatin-related protein